MPPFGHYQASNIRWSIKESQAATCNKGCSKCGQLHLTPGDGWGGHEYTVKVVANEETIRCVCPPEPCDAFLARTGFKNRIQSVLQKLSSTMMSSSGKSRAAVAASNRLVLSLEQYVGFT